MDEFNTQFLTVNHINAYQLNVLLRAAMDPTGSVAQDVNPTTPNVSSLRQRGLIALEYRMPEPTRINEIERIRKMIQDAWIVAPDSPFDAIPCGTSGGTLEAWKLMQMALDNAEQSFRVANERDLRITAAGRRLIGKWLDSQNGY